MLTFIALFIFLCALSVSGRAELKAVTYCWSLEQEPVHSRIVGVSEGDMIKVLTTSNQQIRVRVFVLPSLMRRRKAKRSASGPSKP
jgi:hypothetical protein